MAIDSSYDSHFNSLISDGEQIKARILTGAGRKSDTEDG